MNVHYINTLLFAVPLNILVHNDNKPSITPRHTSVTRLLCECELYAPANYDNDTEMKKVMENFSKQTQQRFHEYDERMKITRQKCKEQCDKEIQKIILKDKLEKELMDKFATLQTDIQSDAIPTCVCEKSMAEKMEKNCFKYGRILGTAVPEFGSIGGTLLYVAAVKSSVELGIKMGMETTISNLKGLWGLNKLIDDKVIEEFVTPINYGNKTSIIEFLKNINSNYCSSQGSNSNLFCNGVSTTGGVEKLAARGADIAEEAELLGAEAESAKFAEMTSASAIFSDPLVISAIAVVTIAVILLIIYLILRYRRKKKMKKKLQYIKLLEE
ncbi:rifin PIR protein, putative [Plasmodium reichenowi]|uniref:Rifin PIR protein, putative n=1 Tax=Plasmodium reichenowi TaxID=5854 RepID=A0A2P9DSD8_PLARE|nr:rifin PIR protein, putative [Plasmodium reichenowi]